MKWESDLLTVMSSLGTVSFEASSVFLQHDDKQRKLKKKDKLCIA